MSDNTRTPNRARIAAFATVLVVLGVSAVGMGAAIKAFGIHLQKSSINAANGRVVASIPRETASWIAIGQDQIESAEVVETLRTQNYLNRIYVQKDLPPGEKRVALDLHLAYYTGMIDTVPHVPERCFVGGGFQQTAFAQIIPLDMDTSGWSPDPSVPENLAGEAGQVFTTQLDYTHSSTPGARVRLPRDVTPDRPAKMRISMYETPGGAKVTAGYFFIANGGTVPNATDVRALAFDLTSDYAFYLKVQVTTSGADSPEELAEYAASLLSELMGEIMQCVPDWIEVQTGRYPEDNPRRKTGA